MVTGDDTGRIRSAHRFGVCLSDYARGKVGFGNEQLRGVMSHPPFRIDVVCRRSLHIRSPSLKLCEHSAVVTSGDGELIPRPKLNVQENHLNPEVCVMSGHHIEYQFKTFVDWYQLKKILKIIILGMIILEIKILEMVILEMKILEMEILDIKILGML